MKHFKQFSISGEIVKEDDRYKVIDNTDLKNLVVSTTILKGMRSTTGHSHEGQEEIYMFTEGVGKMIIDDHERLVEAGDIVLVEDGEFHRVFNTRDRSLIFICIFNGKRKS